MFFFFSFCLVSCGGVGVLFSPSRVNSVMAAEQDGWNIQFSDFKTLQTIGKGNFGKVYKGVFLGAEVAIKQLYYVDDEDMQKYIQRELATLKYDTLLAWKVAAGHRTTSLFLLPERTEAFVIPTSCNCSASVKMTQGFTS